jgi:SpoVK/Ycf46/Vps4 family AAA+-type ATPase
MRAPYPLIYIDTHEEERALSVVRRLAADDDRPVGFWSPVDGFKGDDKDDGDVEHALQRVARADDGSVIVFRGGHHMFESTLARRRLRELATDFSEAGTTLIFLSPMRIDAPELQKEMARLSMPLPGRDVLRRECEASLEELDEEARQQIDLEQMVSGALGLTQREARRAYRRVGQQLTEALSKNALYDPEEGILEEKRRMIGESETLEFHPLNYGLDDVGGLEVLKQWLEERRRAFSDDARNFGLPMPKGLLLIGVQGCGKSLTAKAVARHWNLPLMRLDLGNVFDGQRSPEQALRSAIETSEAIAPCVLWVDEIEKGFAGEADGRAQRVLGSLLTWQQEKSEPVFLVATANDVQSLPPELLRKGRFDEIFFIDLPERHERQSILNIHLNQRGRTVPERVAEDLAAKMEYFSGAEIEQVVVSAMYTAFADGRDVSEQDLEYAVQQTVPLYRTYEEQIKSLREWAHGRARSASHERELLDYFD